MPGVLLLEDREPICTTVSDALTDAGYDVVTRTNEIGALRLLADEEPELVVADWRPDETSAERVIAAARMLHRHLPVIVITNNAAYIRDHIDPGDRLTRVLEEPLRVDALIALAEAMLPDRR